MIFGAMMMEGMHDCAQYETDGYHHQEREVDEACRIRVRKHC